MNRLELRVPPVVVALLVGAAMWVARALAPELELALSLPLVPPVATTAARRCVARNGSVLVSRGRIHHSHTFSPSRIVNSRPRALSAPAA